MLLFLLSQANISSLGASIDARMQGAIFNGIYSLNAPGPLRCTTANCQWEKFATLAVCGSCKDVTSSTQRTCGNGTLPGSQECKYTTPSGKTLDSIAFQDAHTGFASTRVSSTASTQPDNGEFWNDTLLMAMAALTVPDIFKDKVGQSNTEIPAAKVTECELRWCATVYEDMSVSNNELRASKTLGIALQKSKAPLTLNNDNNSTILSAWAPAEIDRTKIPGNATFLVNALDHANTGNYLASLFTIEQATQNANSKNSSVYDISSALLETGNITQTIENLARSMSTRVRTGPNTTSTIGQAFHDETLLRVQWLWLILPCLVVVCGVLFMILTILRSRNSEAPVWKSSTLAVLLHDVRGYLGDDERFEQVEEMDRVAKDVHVRLVREEGDKWVLERM
jgi:hypothetical protein